MRSRMWSMPPSYATPTSTRLYQSVIENTAYLQGCDCAHMHGLCLCRPWVEQFDKHLDWRGLDRGPRARRNDCQLAACDESDPLLDTDGSTACTFASRGISSGAVAAQSIRYSGLLRSSTEKWPDPAFPAHILCPPPRLDEVRWPVACHLEDELEDGVWWCYWRQTYHQKPEYCCY